MHKARRITSSGHRLKPHVSGFFLVDRKRQNRRFLPLPRLRQLDLVRPWLWEESGMKPKTWQALRMQYQRAKKGTQRSEKGAPKTSLTADRTGSELTEAERLIIEHADELSADERNEAG